MMPLARAAAQRALDIDPRLPDAHAALGGVAAIDDFDWKEAERRFELAMASDPVPPEVRWLYSQYLLCVGRVGDAIDELERALEEDPLNLPSRAYLSLFLMAAGEHEDALKQLRQILDLDEHSWFALSLIGFAYASKGMVSEALAFLEKAFLLASWDDVVIGALAGSLMRIGDTSRADALLQRLAGRPAHAAPLGFVCFHLATGDMDRLGGEGDRTAASRRRFLHPRIAFQPSVARLDEDDESGSGHRVLAFMLMFFTMIAMIEPASARIRSSLGRRGGMGEVYKDCDTRLDRLVAVKRLAAVERGAVTR
jgi:tetratricopeptide (TPR) repeat protein